MLKKIYAALYLNDNKDRVKAELKSFFLQRNVSVASDYNEDWEMLVRDLNHGDFYHLHLNVKENEEEMMLGLLNEWISKSDKVRVRIEPFLE